MPEHVSARVCARTCTRVTLVHLLLIVFIVGGLASPDDLTCDADTSEALKARKVTSRPLGEQTAAVG